MLERGTLDDGTPITASMRQQLEMLASRADSRSTGYHDAAVKQHAPIARATQAVYDTADRLAAQSAQNIAEAKEGLGSVGQFAVDVGVAGTQLAGDALLAALTGGSALVPMAVRGFGSGTQQARQEGATLGQQVAYGAGSAALRPPHFGGPLVPVSWTMLSQKQPDAWARVRLDKRSFPH